MEHRETRTRPYIHVGLVLSWSWLLSDIRHIHRILYTLLEIDDDDIDEKGAEKRRVEKNSGKNTETESHCKGVCVCGGMGRVLFESCPNWAAIR